MLRYYKWLLFFNSYFLYDVIYSKNEIVSLLVFILAPAEEAKAPSAPAVAPASAPVDAYAKQDQQQVNAGEEANKVMEKTETELNNKVWWIQELRENFIFFPLYIIKISYTYNDSKHFLLL